MESSLSTSAVDHSVTSSDTHADTVIVADPLKVKEEVEQVSTVDDIEDSDGPLIGNLTAREIRERAMAMIGSGAMNFADLDDVLSELMDKVSADPNELSVEPLLQPKPAGWFNAGQFYRSVLRTDCFVRFEWSGIVP